MSTKLKLDEMEENDSSGNRDEEKKSESIELYPNEGNSRNLLLLWPSGDWEFLNYAYLIRAKFFSEENKIVLTYTDCIVTLRGSNLKELDDILMRSIPKKIGVVDERYSTIETSSSFNVTQISIEEKKQ